MQSNRMITLYLPIARSCRLERLCVHRKGRFTVLSRTFAQTSARSDGPLKEKVRAIPFSQHVKAAEQTFDTYHGHSFFSLKASKAGAPDEVFIPFWVATASIRSRIVQAQIGRDVSRTRHNPQTNRMETYWDTEWYWVQTSHSFEREYVPAQHVGLQVYASHKYRRGYVNGIRGESVVDAKQFTPDMLDRATYNDLDTEYQSVTRKVDPFTVFPASAVKLVKKYIQDSEEALADEFLLSTYRADRTRLVSVDVQVSHLKLSPVYFPAYIYSIRYLGRHFRTFINGDDLSVGGQRLYNWERVALTSAAAMGSLMLFSGGIGWGGPIGTIWLGIVFPTVATSLFTMYYPILSLRLRDEMRKREIQSQANDEKSWDTDWVSAFDAFEDFERYRQWKEERSYRRSTFGEQESERIKQNMRDPKGYYKTLGVGEGANKADIQGAFRGLALKYHPDRATDPKDKDAAKKKFQEISQAYHVLRDPKKRRLYDQGVDV
ncbi:hypothetical protein BC943DRAFT_295967 [Umbelopsis sp. AD052]|nr:hypothetical protein BC943DRAFT_295967 [Umbelopsis sp. AD052]